MSDLKYKVIRSNRRTLVLQISNQGELIVRAPRLTPKIVIDSFIQKKNRWIKTKQTKAREKIKDTPPKQFVSGEEFQFLGEKYCLELTDRNRPTVDLRDTLRLARSKQKQGRKAVANWYKNEARAVFRDRADFFASQLQLNYRTIRLSSAGQRWGSCNHRQGSLNLNWRLIMAPLEIVDYVVVHELCHLREANHSRKFWSLVESVLPDYKSRRKWLKENGHKLTL